MQFGRYILRAGILLILALSVSVGQVSVSLPTVQGRTDTTLNIPITVGSLTGLGVTSFQGIITFDTAIVRLTGYETTGTLSSGFLMVANTLLPSEFRFASAGITPMVGTGTLLILKLELRNAGTSNLVFSQFRFNEGSPVANSVDGKVTVVRPNQKPIFVSRTPVSPIISQNKPIRFSVSTYDPEGAPLIFVWKLNGALVQSGPDSTFTRVFSDPPNSPQRLVCIFTDPGGLSDSTFWNLIIVDVPSESDGLPQTFTVHQNYPNPFNPSTTIQFDLPTTSFVTLEIFDLVGIRIRTLLGDRRMNAGRHAEVWNGLDDSGSPVSSGAYLYRLRAGDHTFSRRMILLK